MAKYFRGTTSIGTAFYSHILNADVPKINGEPIGKDRFFSICLQLDESGKKKLLDNIESVWNEFIKDGNKKINPNIPFSTGLKKLKVGEVFKFNAPEFFRSRNSNEEWENEINVVDAQLNPCKDKLRTELGNGSTISVAYELHPYYINDKQYGVSLRLVAVQIVTIAPNNFMNYEAYGMKKLDGYDSTNDNLNQFGNDVNEEEIPF